MKLRIQISLTKKLTRKAKAGRIQKRKVINHSQGERAGRRRFQRLQQSQPAATRSPPIPTHKIRVKSW